MNLKQKLIDLLFPPKCPFCGRLLQPDEEGLCHGCQKILPWTEGHDNSVEFCAASLSPLHYRDGVRRAVHRLKFGSGRGHVPIFALLMTQCVQDRWQEPLDCVTWVPATRKRLCQRGYNQTELLARAVGEKLGIPAVPALVKNRDTVTQSTIGRGPARRANVVGAYDPAKGVDLTGRHVLLVDDVVTSGATLSECAFCLRMVGAESVVALTIARAR